jgi:hypothetical protein
MTNLSVGCQSYHQDKQKGSANHLSLLSSVDVDFMESKYGSYTLQLIAYIPHPQNSEVSLKQLKSFVASGPSV